jgi:hypothetical protein
VPLTRYCRDRRLGLSERLDLFLQVCRGVHHAHQKGVIHRDLKPSNIIVTEVEGRPVPRIIDFGVAKATGQHLADRTLSTQLGLLIGTPEYMSPEQADPATADIDIRSDVFSLGVLLYELLTGVLPIGREELLRAGYQRIGQQVRQQVPPKPSTRWTAAVNDPRSRVTASAAEARTWARRLRGDLDWITMKALEKDRERRYGSAAALAEDLVRHLENRTVAAGPPSRAYRLRKFVGRNRAAVVGVSVLLVALVAFASWQTAQSRIIARERDRALANERLSLARGKLTTDPTVAVAYALASLEILDQPAAREVARQAVGDGPIRDELPRWGQRGNPISIDASADGRYCAVSWSQTRQPTVGIYDLSDLSLRIFEAPTRGIAYEVDFNADASFLVGNGNDGVHVWRVADGAHLWHLPDLAAPYSSRVFRLADPHLMAVCTSEVGERTQWLSLDLRDGRLTPLGRSRGVQIDSGDGQLPAVDRSGTWFLDYDDHQVYYQHRDDLDSDRAVTLGRHEAAVTAVAIDPQGTRAVSMDVAGQIKVWDLAASPPRLVREFREDPGNYDLAMDPYRERFISTWGSATAHLYDLADGPPRQPLRLLDRTFWAHTGTFLPDGSVLTSRNGVPSGPIAWWRQPEPVAWRLHLAGDTGRGVNFITTDQGRTLLLWTRDGDVLGVPLAAGDPDGQPVHLGRTRPVILGKTFNFLVDAVGRRCLTSCINVGTQVLDLQTGAVGDLPHFGRLLDLADVSASGRHACLRDIEATGQVLVFDLDTMQPAATHTLPGGDPTSVSLQGDSLLVVLETDLITTRPLLDPTAPADTLWRGDASSGGFLLDAGRAAVVRDQDLRLAWIDLVSGRQVELGTTPQARMYDADYQRGPGLLAVGGWWESIEVFELDSGRRWRLPAPGTSRRHSYRLRIDPQGRWLISQHPDQLQAWHLPPDPLFGEPDLAELLDRLKMRTNVRVVPDPTEREGFRVTNTSMW